MSVFVVSEPGPSRGGTAIHSKLIRKAATTMKKQMFCLLLAFCLIFAALPMAAVAEIDGADTVIGEETTPPADGGADTQDPADTELPEADIDVSDGENGDDPAKEEEPPEPIAVEGISLTVKDVTVKARETIDPGLEIFPADATDKTALWVSDNPKVAVVDENGVITATGLGEATVTVTVAEFSASCRVTVKYFSDVPENAYYYTPVYWALANGITYGVNGADFAPNEACTRAMAVALLHRVNGSPAASGGHPFTDVPAGAYYQTALSWAYQNGIVAGTSATAFSPNQTCTRAQIVSMIWRCKRQWPQGKAAFSDVKSGNFYFYPVAWAVEKNITAGTTSTTFSPNQNCTRAQIVSFLHRADSGKNAVLDKSAWQLYCPKAEAVLDSVGRDLRKAFNWSSSMRYYGHGKADMPENASPGSEWFANFGFTNRKGNCYVMAATFWEMAVCLGYDSWQMSGKVPLRVGGLGPHSWVEIVVNGRTYVCDPDFTYGTGRNGYLINYGQSGTWRYTSYSKMKR